MYKKVVIVLVIGVNVGGFTVDASALKYVDKAKSKVDKSPCIGDRVFTALTVEEQAQWFFQALQLAPMFFSGKCCQELPEKINYLVDVAFQKIPNNKEKDSVLLYAVKHNNTLGFNCLVEKGFSLDSADIYGNTIWHFLAQKKYSSINLWNKIIERKINWDVFTRNNTSNETPLALFLRDRPLLQEPKLEKIVFDNMKTLNFGEGNNFLHILIQYNQPLALIKNIFNVDELCSFALKENYNREFPGDTIIVFNKLSRSIYDYFLNISFRMHYQAAQVVDYFLENSCLKNNHLLLFSYLMNNEELKDKLEKSGYRLKDEERFLVALFYLYAGKDIEKAKAIALPISCMEGFKGICEEIFNGINDSTVKFSRAEKIKFFDRYITFVAPFYNPALFRDKHKKTLLHIFVEQNFPLYMIDKLFTLGLTGYEKDAKGKIARNYAKDEELKTFIVRQQSKKVHDRYGKRIGEEDDDREFFESYSAPIAFFIDDTEQHYKDPLIATFDAVTQDFLLHIAIEVCPLIVSKNIFYNIFCRKNNMYEINKSGQYTEFIDAVSTKDQKKLFDSLYKKEGGKSKWNSELLMPLAIANTHINIVAWDFYIIDTNFIGMVPKTFNNRSGLRIAEWLPIPVDFFDYFKATTSMLSGEDFSKMVIKEPNCVSVTIDPYVKKININALLAKIFVTNNDFLQMALRNKKPSWVIYGTGHGLINDSIIGLSELQFKELLSFFNTQIMVNAFFYTSCFSGGSNSKNFFTSFDKKISNLYSFTIVSDIVTDQLSRKKILTGPSISVPNVYTIQPEILHGQKDFYNKCNAVVSGTITVEDIIRLLKFSVSDDQKYTYVRLPNTEWFNVVDVNDSVAVIGENVVLKQRDTLDVAKFFKHKKNLSILALYPHYMPFSIDLSGVKNNVRFIPMSQGNYYMPSLIINKDKGKGIFSLVDIFNASMQNMYDTSFFILKVEFDGTVYSDVIIQSAIDHDSYIENIVAYYSRGDVVIRESISNSKSSKEMIKKDSKEMQEYEDLKKKWKIAIRSNLEFEHNKRMAIINPIEKALQIKADKIKQAALSSSRGGGAQPAVVEKQSESPRRGVDNEEMQQEEEKEDLWAEAERRL